MSAARTSYEASLVEALQRSWLDGPRASPSTPTNLHLAPLEWTPETEGGNAENSGGVGLGGRGGGGEEGGRNEGFLLGGGGMFGAAVRGLGEEIGGTANGVLLRAHDAIGEQVHQRRLTYADVC